MASALLLGVFLLSGSLPVRAQDTRTDQAGSVLREYVDKGYCTYTYVVPPGSRTGGCTPPGLESQLAETKEETGRLKNQVDRLSSLVETLLSQQSDLSNRLSEERARSAQLEQNLTRELQEQESRLTQEIQEQETRLQAQVQNLTQELQEQETRVQNLTTTLYEHDMTIKQRLQCTCERLVPCDIVSSTAATLPNEPESTTVALLTGIQVRLVGGSTPLAGRVEVRNGTGPWGSVCDDRWDLQDAHVVCRQLGFGTALQAKLAGYFGEGSGNVWLDEVACGGSETNLGDCPADLWGQSDCSHKEDAGVVCEEKSAFRLSGGHLPWEGRVEFRPGDKSEWGAVCNNSWTEAETGVVCRQLGYTDGANAAGLKGLGEGTGRIWLGDVTCSGEETNILSCGFTWEPADCDHRQDVQVTCTGHAAMSVRLNGSQNPWEGRVEVRPGNGDWGTVCDDGFDDRDAQVVCRQLGYLGGVARVGGVYPEGTGDIWLENLICLGNESSVADCEMITMWGDHDCSHKEDAGVICVLASDCADIYATGRTTSGVYKIRLNASDVEAYCDMDTAAGGWTVLQRRQDGSVPFNRTWEEYKQGFGNKNGEYWLGNENIHLLTQQKAYTLRVDLEDWGSQTGYALYTSFRVSGESDQYRLHISGYSGTAGNSMGYNNGWRFSTVDRDNDDGSVHCSQGFGQGGWWYRQCSHSYLNGRYLDNCGESCPVWQGVVWHHWRGNRYSLKSVSMKIRP